MFSLVKVGSGRSKLRRHHRRACTVARREQPRLEVLEARVVLSSNATTPYLQTNLVSDVPGLAQITDSNLVNPWGVSFSSTSPFWVSDQGTSVSTLYTSTTTGVTKLGLTVSIPKTASGPQGPTGQVHNDTSSFVLANNKPASFIFASLNGTISAWNGGNAATIEWTTPGAVYTGLTTATNAAGSFLYAADGAQNRIDAFDGTFKPHNFGPNAFVDPDLKPGLVPFNVEAINGDIYVSYAPNGHAAQTSAQPGQGAVAAFTTSGRYLGTLISGGQLASPWGMTLAPAGFGTFSGDLLVGNFAYGDSVINAFDPSTGDFRGTLSDASGKPIENPGLWTVTFGNGVSGDANTLYFTAGIDAETHGLFGSLQAIPPLSEKAPLVPNLPNGAFQTLTTVPANGDVNPYGVAFVPQDFPSGGSISPGDILVSNFNNSANQQGTGTTIVSINPSGGQSVFYQGSATSGLTTALGVLKSGFVIVSNVPGTYDSMGNLVSVGQGSLSILDRNGNVVDTLSDPKLLDGPWDLTINDQGHKAEVFVSNVLNGVVTRIDLSIPNGGNPVVTSMTQIASGYVTRSDPSAFEIGPTGLAYDAKKDVLYVAATGDNAIFAIPDAAGRTSDAGTGSVVYQDSAHLRGPLGLVLLPNGDLVTANGDAVNGDPTQPSELVEFTPKGQFVGQFSIDASQGAAFGVAVSDVDGLLRFAAVEDVTNSVDVWTFSTPKSHGKGHGDNGDDQGSDEGDDSGSNGDSDDSDSNAGSGASSSNKGSGNSTSNNGSGTQFPTVIPVGPLPPPVVPVVFVPFTGSGSSSDTTTEHGKGHKGRHDLNATHTVAIDLAQSGHRHGNHHVHTPLRRTPHGPAHPMY